MRPSSDFKALLDELIEIAPLARVDKRQYGDRLGVARSAVEAFVEELEAEVAARGKLYGDMCGILHDCCQKYRLGLGGENIAELVTEEVARLRDYMRYGYNMDEARLRGMRGDA